MYFYSLIDTVNLNTNLFNLNNDNTIQKKLNNEFVNLDTNLFNMNTKGVSIMISILVSL
jgi:phosphotransferase system IIA component